MVIGDLTKILYEKKEFDIFFEFLIAIITFDSFYGIEDFLKIAISLSHPNNFDWSSYGLVFRCASRNHKFYGQR